MSVCSQPDVGLTSSAFPSAVPESGGSGSFSRPAAKTSSGRIETSAGGNHRYDSTTQEGLPDLLWHEFFAEPTLWWDYMRGREPPRHPDFAVKKSKEALWLYKWCKPPWVQSRLTLWDSQVSPVVRGLFGSASTSVRCRGPPDEDDSKVGTCRNVCEHGKLTEAVHALDLLLQRGCHIPNKLFCHVLKKCMDQKDLVLGTRVHALTVIGGYESNAFLANHLICMYASHGSLVEAMQVFSKVSAPDAYVWASIIFACTTHGQPTQAIELYRRMCESTVKPDNRIFVAVLKACAAAGDLSSGKDIHAHIRGSAVEPDIFVQTCLVCMYAKCGSLGDAREMFDRLPRRNVVTWNAMITGYTEQGMGQEALRLYASMQQEAVIAPDSVTFVCLLQACVSLGGVGLPQGKQLHDQINERGMQADVLVGNSLVNMYAKCGSLENAHRLFETLPHRDVVTWNAIIAGYTHQGMSQEAMGLYSTMVQEGTTLPNSVTFVLVLQACATAAALPLGKQLHVQIEERGLQGDVLVGSSLVNMYAKCGSLEDAHQVFDSLPYKEVVAWGALIAGYARRGDSEIVFDLVDRMKLVGVQPDRVTFLSVLTVCSHAGLVDKGRQYFEVMRTHYGITPTFEHYRCMMDLLGRAGHLDEALQMVKIMPFQPDVGVWLTLLGSCRKWSNVEVGRQAFEFAVMTDEKDASAYVLMSNIYADAHMWEEADEMQARRVKCGAWKEPGKTWSSDMGGVVYSFVVGDKKQPESEALCT